MSQFYKREEKPKTDASAQNGGKRVQKPSQGTPTAKRTPWFFPEVQGKARIGLYGYTVLTVFAAIIVVAYIIFQALSSPPPVVETTRPPISTSYVDESGNPTEIVDNPNFNLSSDRKEEFYTFLVAGQSQAEGGYLTDTMILGAYDVPNQQLYVISLPRDTYVRRNGSRMLLNAVYNWGGGTKGNGKETLKDEVTKLTGVPVDFFVMIKWEAFGELVDAIGGVYFDVPMNMNYEDPYQDLSIHVSKGYQLLDGDKAMQVVRFRSGYASGDLGRINTQQELMKAIIKKCLDPSVLLSNLGEYIEIFQNNVTTDLTVSNLTYFGKSAIGGLDMDNVTFATLPNKAAGSHLYPDGEKIVELVNRTVNPYKEDIRLEELTLEGQGSSSSGNSSSGNTTSTPKPSATATPTPTPSAAATSSPEPTATVKPSASPAPTATAKPSASPAPSASQTPAESAPVTSAAPTATPDGAVPTESTAPNESAEPSPTPAATATPEPTATPVPTPTPTPTQNSEDAPLLPVG